MVYPSHYAPGFLGYENPADYPYQVVKHSIDTALQRLYTLKELKEVRAQIRPWLQDFDLGAIYDADMVTAQIQAVNDSMGEDFNGFMFWNPSNIYTEEALNY